MARRAVGRGQRNVKRFTDADKWSDPWFRKLSWQAKIFYLYLLDNCDPSGVWEPDYLAAAFQIGATLKWEDVIFELGDRVYWLQTNARLRVVKFIRFQYGKLSPDCVPHRRVYVALQRHGLDPNDLDRGIPDNCEHTLPPRVAPTLKEEEEYKDKEEEAPDWLKPAWSEWLEARRQAKRKSYTPLGRKKQIAALVEMGAGRAVPAINYSIRQNYQGIIEERTNGSHNTDQRPNSRRYEHVDDYSKVKNHGVEMPD